MLLPLRVFVCPGGIPRVDAVSVILDSAEEREFQQFVAIDDGPFAHFDRRPADSRPAAEGRYQPLRRQTPCRTRRGGDRSVVPSRGQAGAEANPLRMTAFADVIAARMAVARPR